jgi:hypothetical protein
MARRSASGTRLARFEITEESMAEQSGSRESGEMRQERIQREQHRPEQNKGYDEAVRRAGVPDDRNVPPDQRPRRDI